MDVRALSAVAAALLTLGSGCVTPDANKTRAKKPDVTQPGVLPPPQELMKPASAVAPDGAVVPAGGAQPNAPAPQPAGAPPAAPAGPSVIAKLAGRTEKKAPATDMGVAWRNRIAYLPDPTKNGAMGSGIVGQMYLYGGPKMEFAQADGTLTVDLIDETPRQPGQPAARPERWQFDKHTLQKLQTNDETFGKSYVLFLPWPAYRPDVTKVRISARYDPDNGHTLYAPPSTVSIDTSTPLGAPVWDGVVTTTPLGPGAGASRTQTIGAGLTPLPAGGPVPAAPGAGVSPAPLPVGGGPIVPLAPPGAPGAVMPAAPSGSTPEGLPPIAITIGRK